MLEKHLIINNKLGLHARASAKLSKLANSFPCEVKLSLQDRSVNAKSIMDVLMLAAAYGNEIILQTSGEQEQQAMQAISSLILNKFTEEN